MSQHTELIAKLIALSEMLEDYEGGGFSWREEAATAREAADALQSESLAQAAQALAQLPSEGKTIEALAPTEAALRDLVRQSEDLGLYDADFQIGAQEREAFEAEFDQLCKDYSIYGLIEARLCKVFFEAGRAGRKV